MLLRLGYSFLFQGSCRQLSGEVHPAGDEGYDNGYWYDVEEWTNGYGCWPCEYYERSIGCAEAYGVKNEEVFDEDGQKSEEGYG